MHEKAEPLSPEMLIKEHMISKQQLQEMQLVDPKSVSKDDLVDLRDVVLDRTLPLQLRFLDFVRQVKNPYLYKVGQIEVKIDKGGSIRFTDALARGLLNSNSKEE